MTSNSDIRSAAGPADADDHLAPTALSPRVAAKADENGDADTDDEDGEGKSGNGGKTGGRKPKAEVSPNQILIEDEENLSLYDTESLIEKLKLLIWAPFSTMVPGASSFESESDLKRIMFLGQIGLVTGQIDLHDIADPLLIARLEHRNQQRQAAYRAEMMTAGAAASFAAGLTAGGEDKEAAQKRNENKGKSKNPSLTEKQRRLAKDALSEFEANADPGIEDVAEPEKKPDPKPAVAVTGPKPENTDDRQKLQDQGDFARKDPQARKDDLDIGDVMDFIDSGRDSHEGGYDTAEAARPARTTELASVAPVQPAEPEMEPAAADTIAPLRESGSPDLARSDPARSDPAMVSSGQKSAGLEQSGMVAQLFNMAAVQTEAATPDLKTELKVSDPAPKMDTVGPMG